MTFELARLRYELNDLKGKVVYDIDKIRQQLFTEMNYMFLQGCLEGIEYPDRYRMTLGTGFNQNSPVSWCGDMQRADKYQNYIYNEIKKAGR
jgi:hypothetical protein